MTSFPTPLTTSNRLVSMLLDHVIMGFLVMLLEAPAFVIRLMHTMQVAQSHQQLTDFPFHLNIFDAFAFSLYLNKDIYCGQSIGKRIMKLQVLNHQTGQPAGPLRCFVRNLTTMFWLIELIATLINVERRLGDYIAGTRIAPYDPGLPAPARWPQMALAVVIGTAFIYLFMVLPMELWTHYMFTHFPPTETHVYHYHA